MITRRARNADSPVLLRKSTDKISAVKRKPKKIDEPVMKPIGIVKTAKKGLQEKHISRIVKSVQYQLEN